MACITAVNKAKNKIFFVSLTRPTLNQRTSGPVNAHLTPGPGIYFNAFIHVYNPLGTNVVVNRKPQSLCPFVASFKMISSKSDFIHIFNDFVHVRGLSVNF